MLHWKIEPVTLDLKYTWKISRNSSDTKTNLIVTVTDGIHTGKGEAAPNVRYNESSEDGIKLFSKFAAAGSSGIDDINELHSIIKSSGIFNSLAFAVESAWFRLEELRLKKTFYELTGIPVPGKIETSYTIPIMETGKLKTFFEENRLHRFPYI
jgi:hypothetical protein